MDAVAQGRRPLARYRQSGFQKRMGIVRRQNSRPIWWTYEKEKRRYCFSTDQTRGPHLLRVRRSFWERSFSRSKQEILLCMEGRMPDGNLRLDRRGNGIPWFWTKAKDNLIYHSHTDVPFTPPSDCC